MKTILTALLSLSALVSPAKASDTFTPSDNGSPDTERGTGTRFTKYPYRGSSRKEGCLQSLHSNQ